MAKKDFVFMFFPGDYLRDTQCLSEKAQVAYDRIMCEHMRSICIAENRICFFLKRLNEEEKEEVFSVLTKCDGGYQIDWVVQSIEKYNAYRESRRKNATKGHAKHMQSIRSAQEYEYEDEYETKKKSKKRVNERFEEVWKQYPKPVGKKAALRSFNASVETEEDFSRIKKALNNYKNSHNVKNGFIQNGSTWFNNWEDWEEYKDNKPPEEETMEETLERIRREKRNQPTPC